MEYVRKGFRRVKNRIVNRPSAVQKRDYLKLRAQLDRFCDHGVCDVQRQQRIFYRSSTVTNQKTGVIKIHLIPHRRDLI